ncbi:unnamed protein product [Spirodela intermedia]|uniref:Uncharacterized protein n=2 Tax=Spirodela intermedia TaxID=51605 RepID=A0A7I8K2G4_SPIIN|nr:unnamed protein product [Spirodela intermedia]CAA6655670.1 unnamed protein product [Spirodela intermedia]CAA7391003.1 unnamed protein product [Spirodela intermedia]
METKVKIDHYRPIKNLDTEERNYIMKDRLQEENTRNLRNDLKTENAAFSTLKDKDTSVLKQGNSKVPFIKGDLKTDLKAHLFCTYC